MQTVYLGIGSNIPPRKQYILNSLILLKKEFSKDFFCSSLFETAPYLDLKQSSYINCCVEFNTDLSPLNILKTTSKIEKELGRHRSGRQWQSRTIDIDILLYGDLIIDSKDLKIPHYDLLNRDFFLIPLLELNDELKDPMGRDYLKSLINAIPDNKLTHPEKIDFEDPSFTAILKGE